MSKNFFRNVKDLAQLRVRYAQLSKQHHPDIAGGDESTMKEINAQRDAAARRLLKGQGMSDSDIEETMSGDLFADAVSKFADEVMAGGNPMGNLVNKADTFVDELLKGNKEDFTNENGDIDNGKVIGALMKKFLGVNPFDKKQVDQGKSDQKKLGS